MGMYGWNQIWKGHAGLDILGYLPVSKHFEACAALEVHSPKVFAATVTARPKFGLAVGEIFLDASAHYRQLGMYSIADFSLAASVGYRMDYVSVQVGITPHFTFDLDSGQSISEPLNMLYRLSVNVRPATSRWNAGAGVANYTDYEYERTWEPMYFFDGHYDVNDKLSVLARVDLKPAGAFHLAAQFWGVAVRAGVGYKF